MYRRCDFLVLVVLVLGFTAACSGPAAEKAIFVQRESTTTDAVENAQQTSLSSTTLAPTLDERSDGTIVATTIDAPTHTATTTTLHRRPWTLLAGGDVLLDLTEPEGIDPFTNVRPSLSSADVAIVNLEMAITERGEPYDKEFVFRAPRTAALTLAAAGVDVVSLANNHVLDFGPEGLEDTISVLDEVAGNLLLLIRTLQ